MIYPALVSATFRQFSVEEIVRLCKENGIKAVEWGSDIHVPVGDVETVKYVKNLCDENDIDIASYASYYVLGRYEDYKTEFAKYIESAKILGAKVIRTWPIRQDSCTISKELYQDVVKEANDIAKMAQEAGIILSYEYHHNTLTDTLKSTQRFLKDTINTKTHWQRPIGMGFDECFMQVNALKREICNVHVNNRHTDWKYYPISEIKEQWVSYLDVLKNRDGRDIYACIEFVQGEKVEQFIEDAKTLNSILDEIYS